MESMAQWSESLSLYWRVTVYFLPLKVNMAVDICSLLGGDFGVEEWFL